MALQDKAEVIDGSFVSQRIAQVVAAIREYSDELDVEYIPPGVARRAEEAAFRIIHRPEGREPYVIFHVKTEEEFDSRVLMRIIQGDQRSGAAKYSDVLAAEKAAALVAEQRAADLRDEAIDKMYHAFKSPLNTYVIDKDTVIKDGIPFNAKGY